MRHRAEPVDHRPALQEAIRHLRAGRLDEAGSLLHSVVDADPDQPDARHLLGLWHHERGEHDDAVGSIRRAISSWPLGDPSVFLAWNNLGNVLVENGRPHEAEDAYRAALAAAPHAGGTWTNLAGLLRRGDRSAEAEQAARQATVVAPEDPQAWFTLARVLVERGDVAGGLRANAHAITLAPRDQIGREEVLRSLTVLGHRDEAATLWREWLADQPDDPVALHHEAACSNRYVARAADAYVTAVFDGFAAGFDARLAKLDYRAPELVTAALVAAGGGRSTWESVGDLGCGTGLLGPLLRAHAGRLTGVDLSPEMLARARRRKVYDELACGEIVAHLRRAGRAFDALVAADVFCYFGVLDDVIAAAGQALRPGGVLVFTVEASVEDSPHDWSLEMSGRYVHHAGYVTRVMSGFTRVGIEAAVLRMEAGLPVRGLVVTGMVPSTEESAMHIEP